MLHLTAREELCLNWVAQGKTSAEIGLILNISARTVNFHIQNACGKMGVRKRQAAIAKAILEGRISGIPQR